MVTLNGFPTIAEFMFSFCKINNIIEVDTPTSGPKICKIVNRPSKWQPGKPV